MRYRGAALGKRLLWALPTFGAYYSPSPELVLRCPAPFFLITMRYGMM